MQVNERREGRHWLIADRERLGELNAALFDPETHRACGTWLGSAQGRGAAHFIRIGDQEAVLRHYRRGGLAARCSEDLYLWTGLERSRAWREWRLLAWLRARELPVPAPVAARVSRHGLGYRADLITLRIPAARPLAETLRDQQLAPELWARIGATVARLHQAGVWHADLNAHNVLLDADGAVHLIDFDRGAHRSPGAWQADNLARLQRSLNKLARLEGEGFAFAEADWARLRAGYAAA
jgi:3-deoxy-D-manno-octulosonic acid kinase